MRAEGTSHVPSVLAPLGTQYFSPKLQTILEQQRLVLSCSSDMLWSVIITGLASQQGKGVKTFDAVHYKYCFDVGPVLPSWTQT